MIQEAAAVRGRCGLTSAGQVQSGRGDESRAAAAPLQFSVPLKIHLQLSVFCAQVEQQLLFGAKERENILQLRRQHWNTHFLLCTVSAGREAAPVSGAERTTRGSSLCRGSNRPMGVT